MIQSTQIWDSKPLRSSQWTASFMSQYSFRPVRSKAAYQLMSQGWIPRLPSIAEKTRGFFIKQASYQVWNMEGWVYPNLTNPNPTQKNAIFGWLIMKTWGMRILWKMMLENYFDLNMCRFLCEWSGSSQHRDKDSNIEK